VLPGSSDPTFSITISLKLVSNAATQSVTRASLDGKSPSRKQQTPDELRAF
jgi:hypothetical protein